MKRATLAPLARLGRALDRLTGLVVIVLISLMLIDVSLGIFFRYVLGNALPWTEELARYLMVWAGFLAASLALKEGAHVGIEGFLRPLPGGLRRLLVYPAALSIGIFLSVTAFQGIRLLATISQQTTPVLGISMMWPYLAIPVGSLLMLLQLVLQVIGTQSDGPAVSSSDN